MIEIPLFKRNEINTTYQSFIYETPVKELLISNYEWPSPIDTFVTDPLIVQFFVKQDPGYSK